MDKNCVISINHNTNQKCCFFSLLSMLTLSICLNKFRFPIVDKLTGRSLVLVQLPLSGICGRRLYLLPFICVRFSILVKDAEQKTARTISAYIMISTADTVFRQRCIGIFDTRISGVVRDLDWSAFERRLLINVWGLVIEDCVVRVVMCYYSKKHVAGKAAIRRGFGSLEVVKRGSECQFFKVSILVG